MLSQFFTTEEFEFSPTATRHELINKMDEICLGRARELCINVLDVIRIHYNSPLIITSGFRSLKVNLLVGGSMTSQHCKGMAADFHVLGKSTQEVFQDIKVGKIEGLKFDQLINESGWVHISFNRDQQRHQCLIAHFSKTGVTYTNA